MALSQGMSRTRVCVVVSRETAGFEFMRGIASSCSRSGRLWLEIFVAHSIGKAGTNVDAVFPLRLSCMGLSVMAVSVLVSRGSELWRDEEACVLNLVPSGLAAWQNFALTLASTDASHFNRQGIDCDVT